MQRGSRQRKATIRSMTFSALYLALALVLPFLTGQIPEIGAMLSPMHIPVLLCGFVCGWSWGVIVGFIAPLLRSLLFGMPAMYPAAVAMAFELAAYGLVSGVMYRLLKKVPGRLYIALVTAMIAGRLVWGGVQFLLAGLSHTTFTWELFLAGAVTKALPGIILHIVIIPPLVLLMQRAGLTTETGSPDSKKGKGNA